jgi:hypothetical protein
MKLADLLFRDLRLFIDTFTAPEHADELYAAVSGIQMHRWGVAEPGEGGRIVVGVDGNGQIATPKFIKSDPSTWIAFFSFFSSSDNPDLAKITLSFSAHHWASNYEGTINSGIEVPLRFNSGILELIKAAGK